jgi:transposase
MASPKLEPLVLTGEERQVLEGWARRRKTAQALALRSRIVLACSDGAAVSAVAAELGISRATAGKWRSRFLESRLEGLSDEPRPGRPRTVTDEHVEKVITATLEQQPPNGDTHWSTRSMARSASMSQSAVSRIWRAFGLRPHIVQTWKLSADPQFIDKVRDVVGLYMSPPENALVLCVDEKSQIQALDRTAPCLPMLPTTPARMTHDYVRNGTTSLFAAFDLASGSVIAQPYRRHRHQEFLRFLKLIDAAVPKDLDLHLVLDNYATHKTPAIHQWLLKHPRFQLHFTPTSSSWMNLVSISVMLLVQYGLGMGVNLYARVPAADQGAGIIAALGRALISQPVVLAVHAGLGLLMLVAGVSVLVRAIVARHRPAIASSAAGLAAIAAAAFSGATFVSNGQDGASMAMAILTGVALLCYLANLLAVVGAKDAA